MFDHVQYRNNWLADPTNPSNNDAARYGVKVHRVGGEPVWGVVGVHHLTPEENKGKHNIYVDVVDNNNKRYPPSTGVGIGWEWEGRFDTQSAPVKPLDKPDWEPHGNVDIYRGMKMRVWISHAVPSDSVTGLTSDLPDELGPGGEIWNSVGHHSFYILFKLYDDGVIVDPPPSIDPGNPTEVAKLRGVLIQTRSAWVKARDLATANIHLIDNVLGSGT